MVTAPQCLRCCRCRFEFGDNFPVFVNLLYASATRRRRNGILVLVFGLCLFLVPWIYYSLYVNAQGCYERINGTSTGTGTNGTDEVWHSYTWQWSSSAYYILECEGKNKCDGLCPTSDEALEMEIEAKFPHRIEQAPVDWFQSIAHIGQ